MARKSAAGGRGNTASRRGDPTMDALGALAGACILLDHELRIVGTTSEASELLGFTPPKDAPALRVICGNASNRPVAEALVAGRDVVATIPNPGSADAARNLTVRGRRLGSPEATSGYLLMLSEGSAVDARGPLLFHGMWTLDPRMKEMFRVIERAASEDVTVLVRGETGAGKELVARALHALSPRARGPLRAINCAALPPNLLESELFGHARGAFTGAVRDVKGHVELAHQGTLFLDEIAELPLELQAKLLRVLETRTVLPVGAREPVPVDVRFVSATHRPLRAEVAAGRFRADLMYRLRVIPIFIPPLRERPGDVELILQKTIEAMNGSRRRTIEQVAPAALTALARYPFHGNVRELRNAIEYAYTMGDGPVLLPGDLPPEVRGDPLAPPPIPASVTPTPAPASAPSPEAARILRALERAGGNRARAARVLGMSRVTLWRRLRELGLEEPTPPGAPTRA